MRSLLLYLITILIAFVIYSPVNAQYEAPPPDPPPPQPTPTPSTPASFIQNPPAPICDNNNNPMIRVRWTDADWATDYIVYYITPGSTTAQGGWHTGKTTNYDITNLTPNQQYSFVIQGTSPTYGARSDNGRWSHQKFGSYTVFPSCTGTPTLPVINLWLNDTPYYEPPLVVEQNVPVSIRWAVNGASSCTADPAMSDWSGAKNPVSGTQPVSTANIGDRLFGLRCFNPANFYSYRTILLRVASTQNPYIQTTGGDVHTNETIFIPQ